ncbi:hypothetical protein MAP00_005965 [Monascus purpureus]|nr:hypothetical protein MAP00_005965 [Monascus purpureus]
MQALFGWIQNSLAVKLPNLARSGNSAPSQTTFDQSKGLASLFPTGVPTTMEQSASAQQHFLERIRTAPDLQQARLYGNELASFRPHVESVLVNLKAQGLGCTCRGDNGHQ